MKLRLRLLPLLLICVLAMGCARDRKPGLELDNLKTTTSSVPKEENDKTETSDGQNTSTTTTQSETTAKEQAYVLKFEATTINGEKFTSECFANSKLTMINVWATYCNPCLSEMPYLGELAVEYDSSKFQIIGVVCDVSETSGTDSIEYARGLVEHTKSTTYTHLLLNNSLEESFVRAVYAVPTTFFVNQKGELLGYVEGAYNKSDWKGVINDLLEDME